MVSCIMADANALATGRHPALTAELPLRGWHPPLSCQQAPVCQSSHAPPQQQQAMRVDAVNSGLLDSHRWRLMLVRW